MPVPAFYLGIAWLAHWAAPNLFGNEDVLKVILQVHVAALAVVAMFLLGVCVTIRRHRREMAFGGLLGLVVMAPSVLFYLEIIYTVWTR
jgi:hypothetical protein